MTKLINLLLQTFTYIGRGIWFDTWIAFLLLDWNSLKPSQEFSKLKSQSVRDNGDKLPIKKTKMQVKNISNNWGNNSLKQSIKINNSH